VQQIQDTQIHLIIRTCIHDETQQHTKNISNHRTHENKLQEVQTELKKTRISSSTKPHKQLNNSNVAPQNTKDVQKHIEIFKSYAITGINKAKKYNVRYSNCGTMKTVV